MQFVKLQLGCLLIIMYIVISYIRETLRGQIPCNRHFDFLMAVAPWAVFFDGLTAWTVNHMDLVPAFVNRGAHLLLFLSMDLYILATTAYFYDQLLGFRKKKIGHLFLVLPGLLSLMLIIGGFGRLTFIQGENTWYSIGFPVYVCYATVVESRDSNTGGHIRRTRAYVKDAA